MSSTTEANDIGQVEKVPRRALNGSWWSVSSALVVIYLGAATASAFGTVNAIIGMVLSTIPMIFIARALTRYAIRKGEAVGPLSRRVFGRAGGVIATSTLFLSALYFAVFEGNVLVYAFQSQFGGPKELWAALIVAYTMPLILGRVRRFFERINGFLLPVYWGGFALAVIWAGATFGFTGGWITHEGAIPPSMLAVPGWLAVTAIYLGTWAVLLFAVDFASLAKPEDEKFHLRWTFGAAFWVPAQILNSLIGIFLVFTIPGTEVSETGIVGGIIGLMGGIGFLLVFVSQTRINSANYYVTVANLEDTVRSILGVRLPLWVWATLGAVIIFALTLLPVIEFLLVTLSWLGVIVVAWIGVVLVHVTFELRRERSLNPATTSGKRFTFALLAWAVAAVVGLTLVLTPNNAYASVATVITLALSAVIYLVFLLVEVNRSGRATEDPSIRPEGGLIREL